MLPIQDLTALLDRMNARFVILLCHHNADPDAIGAALALSSLLQRIRPRLRIEIAAAEGPSRLSRRVLAAFSKSLTQNPLIEEADTITRKRNEIFRFSTPPSIQPASSSHPQPQGGQGQRLSILLRIPLPFNPF